MWKKIGLLLVLLLLAACVSPVMPVGGRIAAPSVTADSFTTWDGTVLPLRHWDAAKPRAIIIALHGMSDYSHAFAKPAKFWAQHGISTYAYDQRGFGQSPHPGLWAGGDAMRADLDAFAAALHAKFPHLPIYALGESMGAAVLLTALASAHPPHIAGAILAAPAVWPRADMPLSYRALLYLAEHLVPGLILSNNAGGRLAHVTASDNIPMLRALARDPLFQKTTRVSTLYGLVNLMDAAYAAPAHLKHPPPILLLYGKKDEIIPAKATQAVIAALGKRAQTRCYPQGYHMLLRDLDAKLVWRDITDWIFKGRATKVEAEPLSPEPQAESSMKKHGKKHDLRDTKAPPTSVTNTDERLAGSEKSSIAPIRGPQLIRPTPDEKKPTGQWVR